MSRIQKNVVSYFPHDANACTGDTLTVLQSQFGNDGYAFWFKLLEKLASTDGHFLDCQNSTKWQLLLAKTGVNEITGVEIMNLLVEMQAIDKELWSLKVIWCQKLVDNVSEVYKNRRRETPQKPQTTDFNPITTGNNPITTGKCGVVIQQRKKESKESKVNKKHDVLKKEHPDSFNEDRKKLFEELKKRRGYDSPTAASEAAAMTWMLKKGYTVEVILLAHDNLKLKPFWKDKFLNMQSVKNQIGEVAKEKKGGGLPTAQELKEKWGAESDDD